MSLPAMLENLPTACDVGMKKGSKGSITSHRVGSSCTSTWPTARFRSVAC